MTKNVKNKINKLNIINSEIENLYHKASLKLNMSDSRSMILYCIYETNTNSCMLADVYKMTGISKQTINSAIRELEKDNIVCLENVNKKSKRIVLTEEGILYSKNTIAKLCEAENNAFSSLTDEEIDTYLCLMNKVKESLKNEIEKI